MESLFSHIWYISSEYRSSLHINVIGSKCSFAGGHELDEKAFLFNLILTIVVFNFTKNNKLINQSKTDIQIEKTNRRRERIEKQQT